MIRFQRIGRTNDPAFRIVLVEKSRAAKTGNITEQLGTYNPRSKALTLNEARVKEWIACGAQPTGTVKNLLITKGIIEGKKVNVLPRKTPIVSEEKKVEEKVVEKVEEAVEGIAEEVATGAVADAIEEVAAE
ncbi:MAG: 30S ribosomal protein S16 [bacterium]